MDKFSVEWANPASVGSGEQRLMLPASYLGSEKDKLAIVAECEDADTPFVILRDPTTNTEIHMTDSLADDVVNRIHRALRILRTGQIEPGEQNRMRPAAWLHEKDRVIILAECSEDISSTVILRDPTTNIEIHMSESLAEDIARRMKRALRILPTSK